MSICVGAVPCARLSAVRQVQALQAVVRARGELREPGVGDVATRERELTDRPRPAQERAQLPRYRARGHLCSGRQEDAGNSTFGLQRTRRRRLPGCVLVDCVSLLRSRIRMVRGASAGLGERSERHVPDAWAGAEVPEEHGEWISDQNTLKYNAKYLEHS